MICRVRVAAAIAAICVSTGHANARPAFDDEDIKSCIQGVMSARPNPGPIFAAAYCPCLAREMNKRVTYDDAKNYAKLQSASDASMQLCLAATERWMKQQK